MRDSATPDLKAGNGYAVAFSSGIRQIRHINVLLGLSGVISPWQARRKQLPVTSVLVWGRKQNSRQALGYAATHRLPVWYIEDGWIRTCSENAHSRTSYSLLVDEHGVYYDSTVPSALENYLNQADTIFDSLCTQAELAYAQRCRKVLIDNDITKYNFVCSPSQADLHIDTRPLVLVLDQTRDDASVRFGAMNAQLFVAMLERAIEENPAARVVVRTHPDVVAGRREGYLQNRAQELGIEISACADNPIPWLKASSLVYTGTSQLGYEALLCGCRVKVAGQPFYAGWGLTEDYQPVKRRIRIRTIDQLFHATHVYHARYCCPVSAQRWSLHDCLEHVKLQQRYFRKNAGEHIAIGITPWKRRYLAQFLRSPEASLRFSSKDSVSDGEIAVRWSYSDQHSGPDNLYQSEQHNQKRGSRCIRVEDGFIRSRGLGSDFAAPASLVFDHSSLYFDAGKASDLEQLLNEYSCNEADVARARVLRGQLLAANMTKYNVGSRNSATAESPLSSRDSHTILVVGQVDGDQSLLRGTVDVSSNSELIKAVRKDNPDSAIVYKPHPDVVSGNRQGAVKTSVLSACVDTIETSRSLLDCLKDCDELHTMTSLSGFEALLRGKSVVTYGLPFYAGWGLTRDMYRCPRRVRRRSLDELVYLCLVEYPHYVDLSSGEFVTIEQMVARLAADNAGISEGGGIRWIRKSRNVAASLRYSA